MSNDVNDLYKFADFRFDGERHKLWQNSELILLSPKATELLALLLKQNGGFVSKVEIFEKVWANTFVEDGVLTQNIYTLRKALGNNADGLPIIENKTRLGYRITVPIVKENKELGVKAEKVEEKVEQLTNAQFPNLQTRNVTLLIIASIVLLTIPTISYIFRHKISAFFRKPIESVKFTKLTNTGDLANAVLSPDGIFLAFIRGNDVYLKDIASNKDIKIEIPNVDSFSSLQFSPDGKSLYFRNSKSAHSFSKILKTSSFGGETETIAEKSYSSFSVSPDGKMLAYYSVIVPNMSLNLYLKNLKTKEERVIFESGASASVAQTIAPAWSADSKKIIHINQMSGNQASKVFVIDTTAANKEEINLPNFLRFEQAQWNPDGGSFIISASETGRFFHLWKVYYPNGDAQPITNGLNSYKNIGISADGKKILALQSTENANILIADTSNLNEQKPVTTGNSNDFGKTSLAWIDNQKILFSTQSEKEIIENIWTINFDGKDKKKLTNEKDFSAVAPFSDGKSVYFSVNRNNVSNISKVNVIGENLTEITNETSGNRRLPQVSSDGNWLYYIYRNQRGVKIMRRNLTDGKEEVFLENEKVKCGFFLTLSPDGNFLACPNWKNENSASETSVGEIAVISTQAPEKIQFIKVAGSTPFQFSPDNKSVEFIVSSNEGWQIMRQDFDKTTANPILISVNENIFNFAWSKDGKKLAISRGQQFRDAVLLTEFDK